MLSTNKYLIRVLAVGFITLVIFSIIGFWARRIYYLAMLPDKPFFIAEIKPSGLVPEYEPEPNIGIASHVQAELTKHVYILGASLGIIQNFSHPVTGINSEINLSWINRKVLYNKQTGLICLRSVTAAAAQDYNLYIGPEGVSETQTKDIGRFTNPLFSSLFYSPPKAERIIYFYDSGYRRFFKIDLEQKLITKGPEVDIKYNPVQIDPLNKNTFEGIFKLFWAPPSKRMVKIDEQDPKLKKITFEPLVNYREDCGQNLLVLDKSGSIYFLNKETLQITGCAGYLFDSTTAETAKDLACYQVIPVTSTSDNKYLGICVGTISRDLDMATLSTFDSNGRPVRSKDCLLSSDIQPANEFIYYLVENLHPLALNYISFFTASVFEATDGYRAIFAMPNSCFAQNGRRDLPNLSPAILFDLFILPLPSILLSVFLAVKVRKDMNFFGFSPRAKLMWSIAIIAFGLVAYITYKITRPKITLVTCQNCGQLRRPDMDICHHCKNPWNIPEIIPPDWRVIVK